MAHLSLLRNDWPIYFLTFCLCIDMAHLSLLLQRLAYILAYFQLMYRYGQSVVIATKTGLRLANICTASIMSTGLPVSVRCLPVSQCFDGVYRSPKI